MYTVYSYFKTNLYCLYVLYKSSLRTILEKRQKNQSENYIVTDEIWIVRLYIIMFNNICVYYFSRTFTVEYNREIPPRRSSIRSILCNKNVLHVLINNIIIYLVIK